MLALCYVPLTIIIFQGIGIGIAIGVNAWWGPEDAVFEALKLAESGWALLAAFIFGIGTWILNVYPEYYKAKIMVPGAMWTNVFIYRLAAEDPNESSAVILHTEGDYGAYNRAHRGLYHFLENVLPVVFALPYCFKVYPCPSFVLTCTYMFGRIIY